jgi:hypothetical protein
MKRLLGFLTATFLLAATSAFPAGLAWNPNPPAEQVTEYCVYEIIDGTSRLRGCTPDTTFDLGNRTPGVYTFYATAKNVWSESDPSESVTTPSGVTPPTGVKVLFVSTVTINADSVTIETTEVK